MISLSHAKTRVEDLECGSQEVIEASLSSVLQWLLFFATDFAEYTEFYTPFHEQIVRNTEHPPYESWINGGSADRHFEGESRCPHFSRSATKGRAPRFASCFHVGLAKK